MTKTEYRQYIASAEWQERRKRFLVECSDGHCDRCRLPRWVAILAYDQDLHVHHLSYERVGQESDEDLQALCRRCHELETFGSSDLPAPSSRPCEFCEDACFDRFRNPALCDLCWYEFIASRPTEQLIEKVNPSLGRPLFETKLWDLLVDLSMARERAGSPDPTFSAYASLVNALTRAFDCQAKKRPCPSE